MQNYRKKKTRKTFLQNLYSIYWCLQHDFWNANCWRQLQKHQLEIKTSVQKIHSNYRGFVLR